LFTAPLWLWVAVRIETISLTRSNFCFHPHLFIAPLWFWFVHSEVFGNLVYPKGSNPHPSPALTLLLTFMTSLLPHFVFLSNLSWNCATKQKLFAGDATYGSDGPSVLNKQ
jgi:hypothetical protein